MFKIGDFSKLCRVPVSALRYYANIGLLEPAHTDPFTGYRYYTITQLPRLNRILALRDLNLSLEQIAKMLDETISADEIRGMLRMKHAEIQQILDEEQARLARVAARLAHIEQEGKMPTQEVVLKSIEKYHAITLRQIVPVPSDIGTLLGESYMAISMKGIQPIAPPITVYHDEEFKLADMDVEIILPVDPSVTGDIPLEGDRWLKARDIPAMPLVASIIHTGTYDNLSQTYEVIGSWILNNGYRMAGPSLEIYLTPPDNEGGPVTEIQFPVQKA
jgi:DNA-binding transcriptional MerR regulator